MRLRQSGSFPRIGSSTLQRLFFLIETKLCFLQMQMEGAFLYSMKLGQAVFFANNIRDGQRNLQQHSQTDGIEMKEYAAVSEKTSNGWSAYAPDLPGWGVAAASFEGTEQLLRNGIELHVEGIREDGLPIPEPRTQAMCMAIPAR